MTRHIETATWADRWHAILFEIDPATGTKTVVEIVGAETRRAALRFLRSTIAGRYAGETIPVKRRRAL